MITVSHLTKTYGEYVAVNDVSFSVQPGTVTGFLGPNGAGKSTTMRMIVGLTPPSSGTSSVLGVPYHSLGNPGRSVGVLLDASAQHAGRTGREVLTLGAKVMGLPTSRVDEMLELVGLNGQEGKRRVGGYSLGMRQRLGIAHALLGDPAVLILDEPANGLDPAGIRWMRSLLRGFADRGGAVLLSSHLLSEVEAVADELIVIGQGRIVAQGTKEEMLSGHGVYVRTSDDDAFIAAARNAGWAASPAADGGVSVNAELDAVGEAAHHAGLVVRELRRADGAGLEDLFLTLTADTARERVTMEVAS